MTFISYAQNMEDVMLWRALKDFTDSGFYIDIGAWDPVEDSVTKAFYDRGWRGINVEPNPFFFARIEAQRSRDVNLCEAVTDHLGSAEMNFLSNPGLSTLDDEIASQHGDLGLTIRREPVSLTTINRIWSKHIKSGQDVHFLKIDIEGAEATAIRGNDWDLARPWVLVVESTLPMSQTDSFQDWEPILIRANYIFAYADGLNRFYVAEERSELLTGLRHPPNVFDDFVLFRQSKAEERALAAEVRAQAAEVRAQAAEVRAQAAEVRAQAAEVKAQAAEVRAQAAENRLFRIQKTYSWKLTAPLRLVRKGLFGPHSDQSGKHSSSIWAKILRWPPKGSQPPKPMEQHSSAPMEQHSSAQALRFSRLIRQAIEATPRPPAS